jgi:ABC-type Fe3+-hydroxamate transport system substrate-binding protein
MIDDRRVVTTSRRVLLISMMPCWLAACLLCAGMAACHRESPTSPAAAPATAVSELRLISLSPAISRTLVDLGLAGQIVGRTPYCASIDQEIPVVGDLTNVNFEMLVRLRPTHILVQPPIAGVDPHLQRHAAEHGWRVAAWRLNTVRDIRILVHELPDALFAEESPGRAAVAAAASRIADEIDLIARTGSNATQPLFRGKVLLVNYVDPVTASGAETYLNDILCSIGGQNVVSDRGWVQLTLEDVVRLAPDAIVLVKPDAEVENLSRDLGPLSSVDIPATRERRLAVLTHPDAIAPSSGVIAVASELRGILERLAREQ